MQENRAFEEMMKAAREWLADEEFPASGKLLLDTSADHYLMIEDAVSVGQIIMEALVGIF